MAPPKKKMKPEAAAKAVVMQVNGELNREKAKELGLGHRSYGEFVKLGRMSEDEFRDMLRDRLQENAFTISDQLMAKVNAGEGTVKDLAIALGIHLTKLSEDSKIPPRIQNNTQINISAGNQTREQILKDLLGYEPKPKDPVPEA